MSKATGVAEELRPLASGWLLARVCAAAGIGALGIALRFQSPKFKSDLWYDEVFSLINARLPFGRMMHSLVVGGDTNPPLYTILLHFWLKLGSSDAHVKIFSIVFGMASVGAAYLLGKRLWNRVSGFMAAGLLAASPAGIQYSIEARPYSMVLFFSLLSTYFLLSAIKTDSPRFKINWIGYVVATALAIYSHWFGLLLLPAHLGGLLIWKRSALQIRRLFIAFCAIGVFCLPLIPFVLNQVRLQDSVGGFKWPGKPDIGGIRELTLFGFGGRGVILATAVVLALAFVRVWRSYMRQYFERTLLFICCYVTLPVVIVVTFGYMTPSFSFFVVRYFLPYLIGVLFIGSVSIATLKMPVQIPCALGIVAISLVTALQQWGSVDNAYSSLAVRLSSRANEEVLIGHLSPMSYLPVLHYGVGNQNHKVLWNSQNGGGYVIGYNIGGEMLGERDLQDVTEALHSYRELYLVIDPGDIGRSTRAVREAVDSNQEFTMLTEEKLGKLSVIHYIRKDMMSSLRE